MAAERDRKLAVIAVAERQYYTALKTVTPLAIGAAANYLLFQEEIGEISYKCEWPAAILDPTVPYPDDPTTKEAADIKYAYLLLKQIPKNSAVHALMKHVPRGDSQRAMCVISNYFHRRTPGGRAAATREFYDCKMDNHPHLSIEPFIALIDDKASILNQVGVPTNEVAELTQLLAGLLKEFNPIKLAIQQKDKTITIVDARSELIDYSTDYGILHLTKGGNSSEETKFT